MSTKDPMRPWLPRRLPWASPWYDDDIVLAVRAVADGVANQGQQKLFWRYLMYVTGASDEFADLSFRPDDLGGDRGTVFAEGKRFVGNEIRKMLRPELTPKTEEEKAELAENKSVQGRMKNRRRSRNGNEPRSN